MRACVVLHIKLLPVPLQDITCPVLPWLLPAKPLCKLADVARCEQGATRGCLVDHVEQNALLNNREKSIAGHTTGSVLAALSIMEGGLCHI